MGVIDRDWYLEQRRVSREPARILPVFVVFFLLGFLGAYLVWKYRFDFHPSIVVEDGQIWDYNENIAPFSSSLAGIDLEYSEQDCYAVFYDKATNKPISAIYVRSKSRKTLSLPHGQYFVSTHFGNSFKGDKALFGSKTRSFLNSTVLELNSNRPGTHWLVPFSPSGNGLMTEHDGHLGS